MTAFLASNPLVLCLSLIILALFAGGIRGTLFMKWIIYAIILIFLGGIIVVFIYVTSLAGNEKFTVKPTYSLIAIGAIVFVNTASLKLRDQTKRERYMAHLFITSSSFILWVLTVFLLRTLIVVVKITESFKGALIKFI